MERVTGMSATVPNKTDASKFIWNRKSKRELLTKNTIYNSPYAIEKIDDVGIVLHECDQILAKEKPNKKAIMDWGWGRALNNDAIKKYRWPEMEEAYK